MKKIFSFLVLPAMIGVAAVAFGCKAQNLNVMTRTVNVADFSGVNVDHAVEVDIYPSDKYSVTVTADEDVLGRVTVNRRGEMLNISLNEVQRLKRNNYKVKVRIEAPVVNTVIASGASDVDIKRPMDAGRRDLVLKASGASQIDVNGVTCGSVKIEASGASDVEVEQISTSDGKVAVTASGASNVEIDGTAAEVVLGATGASAIKASKLNAQRGSADASGASSIICSVSGQFTQTTSGMSTVKNRP